MLDSGTGDFVYTPPVAAIDDTFRVRFHDGDAFAEADVVVINNGTGGSTNNPPVAGDFHYVVSYSGSTTHPLPASDPNGDPLTFNLTVPPIPATATVDYDPLTNEFTYTAESGSTPLDTDSFSFTVTDSNFATSPEATVTLRLAGPDARGTYTLGAQIGAITCTIAPDTWDVVLSGDLFFADQFNDTGTLSGNVTVDATAAGQTPISQVVTPSVPLTPVDPLDGGISTSNFQLNVAALNNPVAGITIGPSNTLAVFFGPDCTGSPVYPYTFTPWTNTAPQPGGVLAFDTGSPPPLTLADFINDPDGGAGQYFEIKVWPTLGILSLDNPTSGDFTYTPTASGTDSFTFFHHDGSEGVTVTVTVTNP